MCIAVYKPAGAKFPTKETMKRCFECNPDGAGFMFADGRRVHIEKGFFSFNAFWRALQAKRESFGDAFPYVLHFRITTHGGTRADCCHPFPLSGDMDDLRELSTTARVGVVHNGIISVETPPRDADYSDTMLFITAYLDPILNGRLPNDERVCALIERLCGSRLAILDGGGSCRLIGQGWREDDGVWYSNGSYLPAPKWAFDGYEDEDEFEFYPPDDCPLLDCDDFDCRECEHWRECLEFYGDLGV